jgi:Zn-finger protein
MSGRTVEITECDICHISYQPGTEENLWWYKINGLDVCYKCIVIVARANRMELIDIILEQTSNERTLAELEKLSNRGLNANP